MDPVRILYVDDDAGLGILLGRSLMPHGYHVETVETGEEAMSRLAAGGYDLVALDHNLVHEIGLDLIPQIRALPAAPPIIYVTGSEDARIAVAALKAGAVDYVWKDVQGHYRELLREAAGAALTQDKLRREADEARREIEEARDRAEMLLREVNHRVANSLAMVSSFVQMQSQALSDATARDLLRQTQARIAAIAGVHRRLYTSDDVRVVEINAYLRALVEDLSATMKLASDNLRFVPATAAIPVLTDKAVSLGVIVTELVTNACKYAYGEGVTGEVRVIVHSPGPDTLAVVVEDDGIGWTGQGEIKGSGLGSRILKAMAQTLQADLSYGPGTSGTRATVRFSL